MIHLKTTYSAPYCSYLDWSIIVFRNGFRLQIALQGSIKVGLQETLQSLAITAAGEKQRAGNSVRSDANNID